MSIFSRKQLHAWKKQSIIKLCIQNIAQEFLYNNPRLNNSVREGVNFF